MIIATGIDIVDIKEIQYAIKKSKRFVQRIFTPKELAYCENQNFKFQHFAGRFAVKEAVMKALETGWDKGVHWKQIEVVRGDRKPEPENRRTQTADRKLEIGEREKVNSKQLTVNREDGNKCSVMGNKQLIADSQTSKPKIRLCGKALELSKNMGVENIFVSLSHNRNSAVASVIFEGDRRPETKSQ